MEILDEVERFCKEKSNTGALMITGGWGTGKTYFVEHNLRKKLGEKFIIVRISLFGLNTVEEIDKKIKEKYFENVFLESNTVGIFEKISQLVKALPYIGEIENIGALINVKSKFKGKRIVLVFDDLERKSENLTLTDIIGCINEYCENKGIKTIVVANENKINKENKLGNDNALFADKANEEIEESSKLKKKIDYNELKEKLVKRTLEYKPNIENIVDGLIKEANKKTNEDYVKLLQHNKDSILNLFAEGSNIPKNFRSLRIAIFDYFHIYRVFKECEYDEIDKELIEFIKNYVSYRKSGILFSYKFKAVEEWINGGYLDEDRINDEINKMLERSKNVDINKMRYSQFCYMDDNIIQEKFEELLGIAYSGELELKEYVLLISNISYIRELKIELYNVINWELLEYGIEKCKKRYYEEGTDNFYQELDVGTLNEKEKILYKKIDNYRKYNEQFIYQKKNEYKKLIESKDIEGLWKLPENTFNTLDKNMAEVTFNLFKEADNYDKSIIIERFKKIWCPDKERIHPSVYKEMIEAFELLKNLTTQELEKNNFIKKPIEKEKYSMFLDTVNGILKNMDK